MTTNPMGPGGISVADLKNMTALRVAQQTQAQQRAATAAAAAAAAAAQRSLDQPPAPLLRPPSFHQPRAHVGDASAIPSPLRMSPPLPSRYGPASPALDQRDHMDPALLMSPPAPPLPPQAPAPTAPPRGRGGLTVEELKALTRQRLRAQGAAAGQGGAASRALLSSPPPTGPAQHTMRRAASMPYPGPGGHWGDAAPSPLPPPAQQHQAHAMHAASMRAHGASPPLIPRNAAGSRGGIGGGGGGGGDGAHDPVVAALAADWEAQLRLMAQRGECSSPQALSQPASPHFSPPQVSRSSSRSQLPPTAPPPPGLLGLHSPPFMSSAAMRAGPLSAAAVGEAFALGNGGGGADLAPAHRGLHHTRSLPQLLRQQQQQQRGAGGPASPYDSEWESPRPQQAPPQQQQRWPSQQQQSHMAHHREHLLEQQHQQHREALLEQHHREALFERQHVEQRRQQQQAPPPMSHRDDWRQPPQQQQQWQSSAELDDAPLPPSWSRGPTRSASWREGSGGSNSWREAGNGNAYSIGGDGGGGGMGSGYGGDPALPRSRPQHLRINSNDAFHAGGGGGGGSSGLGGSGHGGGSSGHGGSTQIRAAMANGTGGYSAHAQPGQRPHHQLPPSTRAAIATEVAEFALLTPTAGGGPSDVQLQWPQQDWSSAAAAAALSGGGGGGGDGGGDADGDAYVLWSSANERGRGGNGNGDRSRSPPSRWLDEM